MITPNTRILVVEDMQSMRQMIVKMLNELGYKDVLEAEDGEKGYDVLLTASPKVGLILADWDMPKCNGLQLLKLVRATPDCAKLPYIMVTAKSEMANTLEAVQQGVSSFIVKPFTAEVLRDKFKAIAAKK